jgi:hypothetical protein
MNTKNERFIKLINELKETQTNSSFTVNIFVANIPEKKLINAKKAMNVPKNQTVLILFDETVFGSAKEGMVFTEWGIYYKNYDYFWSISWENLFTSTYTLSIVNEIPIFVIISEDQEKREEIITLPISKPDQEMLYRMLSTGVNVLGNPDEIEINSLDELSQYIEERREKREKKEETNEVPKDNKSIETIHEKGNKKPTDEAEEQSKEQKTSSENKLIEIHPIQINRKIILVCDKISGIIDTATELQKLIKRSCVDEPELRTYAEYKTISFEAELLGEEQDFSTIFFMNKASPSIFSVAWKFNEQGIRYGWNNKEAIIFVEDGAYNNEENKKTLAKYSAKNVQEALARMFYHEEILKFLSEEA